MNMQNTPTKPMKQTCFVPLKPLTQHDTVFANADVCPFVNTENTLLQQPPKINLHLSRFYTFNPHIFPGKLLSKAGVFILILGAFGVMQGTRDKDKKVKKRDSRPKLKQNQNYFFLPSLPHSSLLVKYLKPLAARRSAFSCFLMCHGSLVVMLVTK